jgi:hypothetical protein
MAEVLAAFSLATDLGTGKSMGHTLRACYLGLEMAHELRFSTWAQAELYYSFLLEHSGCAALSLALAPIIQGDELAAFGDITLQDQSNPLQMLGWMRRNVSPTAPPPTRILNLIRALARNSDDGDVRGVCEVAVCVAQLTEGDKEKLRLHPYYTERILSRVPAFQSVAAKAGMHHERLNRTGCYRGLSADDPPVSASILALADDIQERLQASPSRRNPDPQDVLKAMEPEIWTLFSSDCFAALAEEIGGTVPKPRPRHEWPAGLTNRDVAYV